MSDNNDTETSSPDQDTQTASPDAGSANREPQTVKRRDYRKDPLLTREQWAMVKMAYLSSPEDVSFPDIARQFGVPANCVRQHAFQEGWRKADKLAALNASGAPKKLTQAEQAQELANRALTHWASEGEKHRRRVYKIAKTAIKNVSRRKDGLTIRDAADFERVDKVARRALGLEDDKPQVNVAVQLGTVSSDAVDVAGEIVE